MLHHKHPDGIKTFAWTPGPLAGAITEQLPAVAQASPVYPRNQGIIARNEDKKLRAKAVYVG